MQQVKEKAELSSPYLYITVTVWKYFLPPVQAKFFTWTEGKCRFPHESNFGYKVKHITQHWSFHVWYNTFKEPLSIVRLYPISLPTKICLKHNFGCLQHMFGKYYQRSYSCYKAIISCSSLLSYIGWMGFCH